MDSVRLGFIFYFIRKCSNFMLSESILDYICACVSNVDVIVYSTLLRISQHKKIPTQQCTTCQRFQISAKSHVLLVFKNIIVSILATIYTIRMLSYNLKGIINLSLSLILVKKQIFAMESNQPTDVNQ